MEQIAVEIKNGIVSNIATEKSAQAYASKDGWMLVESDPAFLPSEMYKWTVRQADNKLVHISTGMTPDEESQNNFTTLTMQNLNLTKDVKETQSGITSLTQAQLQDAQDKADIKNGMTEITKQLAAMQLQLATKNTTNTTEAK